MLSTVLFSASNSAVVFIWFAGMHPSLTGRPLYTKCTVNHRVPSRMSHIHAVFLACTGFWADYADPSARGATLVLQVAKITIAWPITRYCMKRGIQSPTPAIASLFDETTSSHLSEPLELMQHYE